MNDWREDGEAFYEHELLMQEREEWLKDQAAQAEYLELLKSQETQYEMD